MKVHISKEFQARLNNLKRSGKRRAYEQASCVVLELERNVDVSKQRRSEPRIPDCYKYELPDGYRIVFQKIEGEKDEFLALFVGSHDDIEKYLDSHRGWTFDPRTNGLRRLNIMSYEDELINIVPSPEIQIKKQSNIEADRKPIFGELGEDLLLKAGVPKDKISKALTFCDPDSVEVMEFLCSLDASASDKLSLYLCGSAVNKQEIVELLKGNRIFSEKLESNILKALSVDSEQYIDLKNLSEDQMSFESIPLEDWMLFLHPSQNEFVHREFNGPARLRGVSGSGKTVIAIHRARNSAKKILKFGLDKKVLFITYNRSLAELVEKLVKQLCSILEASKIEVLTIDRWCRDYLCSRNTKIPMWDPQLERDLWRKSAYECKERLAEVRLLGSSFIKDNDFKYSKDLQFLGEEIEFLMGKFLDRDIDSYLSCDRTGRVKRLTGEQRIRILELYKIYYSYLYSKGQIVPQEINRTTLTALSLQRYGCGYADIIVDEVQDLSEINLLIMKQLALVCNSGLLLVGDGAQRIYMRGYSMKHLGINVVGRSFVLKHNYRNTREIMQVASLLQKGQEIGKYDDDPEISQAAAIFSQFTGEKPLVIIAKNPTHEWEIVAKEIKYLTNQMNLKPYEICCLSRLSWERRGLLKSLNHAGIKAIEYKTEEGIGALDAVKISTLHNSKGHEFKAVFITGFFDGAIPPVETNEPEDLEKEAAVLYVAITRAQKLLYMLCPKKDDNNKELRPSRFLDSFREAVDIIDWS